MGPLGEDLGVSLLDQEKLMEFGNDSCAILKGNTCLNSMEFLKGAIKQRETHTTGIEVSCPEVVEVAISFDRDK